MPFWAVAIRFGVGARAMAVWQRLVDWDVLRSACNRTFFQAKQDGCPPPPRAGRKRSLAVARDVGDADGLF